MLQIKRDIGMDKDIPVSKSTKRKAKYSPQQKIALAKSSRKLIRKAKKIKANRSKQNMFSEESDSEDRTRTPSGMELGGKVQGIRTFFSPISKSVSEEAQENSQGTNVKKFNRDRERNRMERSIECESDMVGNQNNNNNTEPCGGNQHLNMMNANDEEEMLAIIAKQIKPLTSKTHESSSDSRRSLDLHNNQKRDGYIKENGSKAAQNADPKQNNMVSSIEENGSENPKTMDVVAVAQLMRSFKQEIKEEFKAVSIKLRDDIKAVLKKECTDEVKTSGQGRNGRKCENKRNGSRNSFLENKG